MDNFIHCFSCGTTNPIDAQFCKKCGYPLADSTPEGQSKTENYALACPDCGKKNIILPDIDKLKCTNCGHELQVQRSDGSVKLSSQDDKLRQVISKINQIVPSSEHQSIDQILEKLKNETSDLQNQIKEKENHLNALSSKERKRRNRQRISYLFIAYAVLLFLFFVLDSIRCSLIPVQCSSISTRVLYCVGSFISLAFATLGFISNHPKKFIKEKTEIESIKFEISKLQQNLHDYQISLEELSQITKRE